MQVAILMQDAILQAERPSIDTPAGQPTLFFLILARPWKNEGDWENTTLLSLPLSWLLRSPFSFATTNREPETGYADTFAPTKG